MPQQRDRRILILGFLLVVIALLGFGLTSMASAEPRPIPAIAQRATDDSPAAEGVIITTMNWLVKSTTASSYYDAELKFPTGKVYRHDAEVEIVHPAKSFINAEGVEVFKGLEDRTDAIYYVYFRAADLIRMPE